MSGLLRPKRKILGHELAGEVEAVGAAVTEFEVGDRVFGALPYLALSTGAHAESPRRGRSSGWCRATTLKVCPGVLHRLSLHGQIRPVRGVS
jgi:NADPH:quinone reductase-like Zn-dependent oxidoreductase